MSTFTNLQSLGAGPQIAAGIAGGPVGGTDVTSTDVCLTHSVEKVLHSIGGLLQDYNSGQATAANRLHSRSRPLPTTSQ